MKKLSSVISVIIMLLTVAFIVVPKPAAAYVSMGEPRVWEVFSADVTSEVVPMYTITTKPKEWYQLKSDGLKLDGASGICYPFDEGRFGWTGAIFQMLEGAWVKLATTVGWVPTEEGNFLACTQAPTAGTYALFAYFTQPAIDACANIAIFSYGNFGDGTIDNRTVTIFAAPPIGTAVVQTLTKIVPAGAVWGDLTNTSFTDVSGEADFGGTIYYDYETLESFTVVTKVNGCTQYETVYYEGGGIES